uniref:Putative secreted protein n=1 Tax=Anopheles darlingi TaxID=43151 RepID=A0A2M4D2Z2_ANODA
MMLLLLLLLLLLLATCWPLRNVLKEVPPPFATVTRPLTSRTTHNTQVLLTGANAELLLHTIAASESLTNGQITDRSVIETGRLIGRD